MNRELRDIIRSERELYIPHIKGLKTKLVTRFTHSEEVEIFKFICVLRKAEYHLKKNNKVFYIYYLRKLNIMGNRLGYFIPPGVLGKGCKIYHRGDIIINMHSVIGEGCIFHGDNCVGNNGADNRCPILGRNIELGIGAKVVGGITLADDIVVGANAVVVDSFLEPGITIVGVPAKKK